jgi:type I restriction enzyme S subunit
MNNLFLLYWLRQNKRQLLRYAAGTTFDEIGRGTFKKLQVVHPLAQKEQQAIAEAISAVDSAIAAAHESIAKAERLQTGLMQQLLTGRLKADGTPRHETDFDTDDRLGLFPKGWKVRKLRQLVRLRNGKSNVTSNLRDKADVTYCYPVFGGNGMTGWSDRYLLEDATVVLGRVGEYCGVVHRTPAKVWITDNALYAAEFPEPVDLGFLFLLLAHLRLNRWKAVTGQPKITQSEILNIRVAIPEGTNEQAEIATKLDGFRQLIEAKQSKITALQRLKKSLMQNLLTGRIRLPVGSVSNRGSQP